MDGWIVWGFVFVFDGPIFVLEVCDSLARSTSKLWDLRYGNTKS